MLGAIRPPLAIGAVGAMGLIGFWQAVPPSLRTPAAVVRTTISVAERRARAEGSDAPMSQNAPSFPTTASPLGALLAAYGRACPRIVRVVPVREDVGLFDVACAERPNGPERLYRIDTRRSIVTAD